MGFLFLGYLVISFVCFWLIRICNKIETEKRNLIAIQLATFISFFPIANLLFIFFAISDIMFKLYIKPNPTIFADRFHKLNNWFTHGKL